MDGPEILVLYHLLSMSYVRLKFLPPDPGLKRIIFGSRKHGILLIACQQAYPQPGAAQSLPVANHIGQPRCPGQNALGGAAFESADGARHCGYSSN
jgi:hypothetical protein